MGVLRMSTKSFWIFLLFILLFYHELTAQERMQADINTASREEIREIPLSRTLADSL